MRFSKQIFGLFFELSTGKTAVFSFMYFLNSFNIFSAVYWSLFSMGYKGIKGEIGCLVGENSCLKGEIGCL